MKSNNNEISIPKETNLNTIDNKKYKPEPILPKGSTEEELEKNIFEGIISNIPQIDYNFLSFEDLTDLQKSITKMLDQDNDIKPLKGGNFKEEECIVIIIELFKLISGQLDLDFMHEKNVNYCFNGKYWQAIDDTSLMKFLGSVAEKTGMLQTRTKQKRVQQQLFEQFCTTFSLSHKAKNIKKLKINLLNGTFCLNKNYKDDGSHIGSLKDFDKRDLIKYQLPFTYDAEADCPLFKKYLDQVLPDVSTQNVLFEYMGYIFSSLKLEKTCILYGTGSNGKSVFFEIIKALLGESNMSYIPMDKLLDEKGYYRVKLHTKLLNYASELGNMKDVEMFKRITSQEPITARSLYKDFIELEDYCKFMFNANTLPRVEQTEAFFRRQLIIPFNITIKDSEKDVELHSKIIENELSGIFNLILNGLARLTIQKKFSASKMIEEQLDIYKRENNNVEIFMSEERYVISTEKIELGVMYQQYKSYCQENGYRSLNRRNFSERLQKLKYEVRRSTGGYYYVFCERQIFFDNNKLTS